MYMGVANSTDTFQQEMNDLFQWFEFIRVCIHDLLRRTKGDCTDYAQKLELTLNKMKESGPKCYIEMYFSDKPKCNH